MQSGPSWLGPVRPQRAIVRSSSARTIFSTVSTPAWPSSARGPRGRRRPPRRSPAGRRARRGRDAVEATARRLAGVLGVLDALDDDRKRGQLAQPGEVVPGQRGIGEDLEVVASGGAEILLGRAFEVGAEDRVLEIVGVAGAFEEGQPGLLQVARLPAGDEGVDGYDDRFVAGPLGPLDEAADEAAVVRPVELEPARRVVSAGLGDLLEGEVGGGAGDHRHADRGGAANGGQLAVGVDDLLDADRGQHQRRRHRRAEQGHGEVALGDVAQHPRHDPPAPEGLGVGAHRVLAAGPSADVVGRPRLHGLDGTALQLLDRDRDRRRLAGDPAHVDLAVVVGEVSHPGKAIGRSRG